MATKDENLKKIKDATENSTQIAMFYTFDEGSEIKLNRPQNQNLEEIDEYFKQIDQITKEDILQAARHVFSNKPVYSILASPDTINNQMPYLNTLTA